MIILKNQFKNKRVIVTGHTGFKGSWLVAWLDILGAKITGISNGYPSSPCHYKFLKFKRKIININIDIKNLESIKKIFKKYQPDFVFHLAAQSLVNKSYEDPVNTWLTNTIGTVNILESLRILKKKCVAVIITSDKCYDNLEIKRGYDESDKLGGKDPYSASKASADIAIRSYVNSFFTKNNNVFIATARAGNVVGGGDWSFNRLIPDCVKSWSKKSKVLIRNPYSTRPWQHVLEAIFGYISLAVNLSKNPSLHGEAFNFGPSNIQNHNVISVVKLIKKYWKDASWTISKKNNKIFKESVLLKLNSKKAKKIINWKSVLTFRENIFFVTEWYKNFYANPKQAYKLTVNQIRQYQIILKKRIK